jgi:predicted DNA-binding protein (MmcQ/YjbR family)
MSLPEHLLQSLRELCLAYPGTEEIWEGSVGEPVWKTGGRIFAMQHRMEGRPSLWVKAPPGAQEMLVGSAPDRYFRPPYVGHNGWVGAWLDDTTVWPELDDLVDDSWRMTAKKTLIKQHDAVATPEPSSRS